jgi:hypothetical protein
MSPKNDKERIKTEENSTESVVSSTQLKENLEEPLYIETCTCGFDRHHHMVSANATYTAWGTFWITIMGVSAIPIRVDFICRVCNEKFDFEIEPDNLKNFY